MRRASIHLGVLVAFMGSVGAADSPKGKLVLAGSSTIAPLAAAIGKRFEKKYPGARVDVQSGGSSRGLADVRSDLADIGLCSRELKPEERDFFAFPMALDGVGLIVHKSNPVRKLTDDQVRAIYSGKISNWKEVNGIDGVITVVNKAEGRATLELFCQYFKLKNSEIKPQVIIGENEQGIKTVAGNPQAIGYVSLGAAEFAATHGAMIQLLPVGNVMATVSNMQNGMFPLSRPLNFVTKNQPQGLVKLFIEFATSTEVQDIVKDHCFVSFPKLSASN